MRGSGSIVLALFLCASTASGEIFKCTEPNGLLKLQNFPCSIDSIGSVATASPPTQRIDKPIGAATSTAVFTKSETPAPAQRAHTLKAVIPTGEEPNGEEPYLGMRMSDVREHWGDPKRTKEINGIEIWFYDGPGESTRGVRFDGDGRVIGIGDEDWQPGPNGS
jgi:hypothetical protein